MKKIMYRATDNADGLPVLVCVRGDEMVIFCCETLEADYMSKAQFGEFSEHHGEMLDMSRFSDVAKLWEIECKALGDRMQTLKQAIKELSINAVVAATGMEKQSLYRLSRNCALYDNGTVWQRVKPRKRSE